MNLKLLFISLQDGEWHNIEDLANQSGAQADKLARLAQFLFKQRIIDYEEITQKIRIDAEWKGLLPIENRKPRIVKLENHHRQIEP